VTLRTWQHIKAELLPAFFLSVSLLAAKPAPEQAEGPILMRISVENVGAHFQSQVVGRFADLVAARAGKDLMVEFYDGARLFKDVDVLGALSRGDVEMAVPGIWQFDTIVPDTAAFMLPSLFARPIVLHRALADGPLGNLVDREIGEALGDRVIGPWLDLGYASLFGLAAISKPEDVKGLTTRVAGGRANAERMKALGALPISISSMDLPGYLDQGAVKAVLTTFETVDSAGLDKHGLKSAYEDREYYPFYIPLASASFWARLGPETRKIVVQAWAEAVSAGRGQAVAAQEAARARLVARGMRISVPGPAELDSTRRLLLAREDDMALRLSVSAEALRLLRDSVALSP
jgi:C4-dicarboxylate-binding protein DctP